MKSNPSQMEYQEKKMMLGDALSVVRFLASDVFQTRLMKILVFATLIIHGFAVISATYYFINILTAQEFIDFAPVYFGSSYLTLAIFVILFKGKMIANIKSDILLWSLDSADKETHTQLKFEALVTNFWALSTYLLALLACFIFMWGHAHDAEMIFSFRLINDCFPEHKKILVWIVKSTYPIGAHLLVVHVYQVVYFVQHIRFQVVLFREYVVHLTDFPKCTKEEELFYNSDYQKEIEKRLIFCVKRLEDFVNVHLVKVGEMKNMIMPFAVCACCLGIGLFLFVFAGDLHEEYWIPVTVTTVTACMTFSASMHTCQALETEEDNVAMKIIEIKWYNFSKCNKVNYLIFLVNAMKARRIQFSEQYSINYELGIAIARNIYSVLTVVINMKNERIGNRK